MAYYAALVSLVQFLKEMSQLSEHQYPNSLFRKQQIASLYETSSHLLELLEDYSPKEEEAAGFLDRIRDAACLAQDLIECRIPDVPGLAREIIECRIPEAQEIIEPRVPDAAYEENLNTLLTFCIPAAVHEVKSIVELQIAERIHRPSFFEDINHISFLYFFSGCHNSDNVNKEVVYTMRRGYEDLAKLAWQLGSVTHEGYKTLVQLIQLVFCLTMGGEYFDLEKLKEELDPTVANGYQDLVKLKEELDAIVRKEYHDMNRVKKAFDPILERGKQNLERLKEDVDSTVGKGYKYLLEKVKEVVDSTVGRGYQDLEWVKEKVDSIEEKEYLDLETAKEEVDFVVIEGYQKLVKLKEEIDAIVGNKSQILQRVKEEIDSIVERGYQNLERVREEIDFVVEKGYKVIFEKVEEEVDSIVKDLKRIKGKSQTTHQDDLQIGAGGVSTQEGPSDGITMMGFEQHLTTLNAQLYGDSSRLEVISIVGMGGIGKTTLARNIFEDKHIHNYFEFRVWITVSQSYHLLNILRDIVDSLNISQEDLNEEDLSEVGEDVLKDSLNVSKEDLNDEDLSEVGSTRYKHKSEEDVLKERIYKHLFGRRYLIIMDDMWDTKIWDDVKWIFPTWPNGSRIIITTRLLDVASLATDSDFVNQIPTLPHHQSWTLFGKKVQCPPELEDIGSKIVKHCGGLPLAIVVVAGLLSKTNKTRDHWGDIARRVSSAAAESDDHFSKILSLSYDHLPQHLKPCFLYLGGFPEDYEISISRLVKLWVAEGFLKPIESKCLEEAAEEYLEELVQRNLVLVTKWRSNGKFKSCSMHDLLRDLCLERARREHFLLLPSKHNAADHHTRRLFVHPYSPFDIDMQKNNVRHVRSIVSFDRTDHGFILHSSSFKPLRVLHAPFTSFHFLFDRISEFINLRSVQLYCSQCQWNIPPSISKLQHLQTLIAREEKWVTWSRVSLPAEIWKMTQLRHVQINSFKLPPSFDVSDRVPSLKMLQTLSTLLNFKFASGIAEMIPSIKKLKLKYIQSYERCKNVWTKFGLTNLVHLPQLKTLAIEIDIYGFIHVAMTFPERFAFPSNLRKLTLDGCRLPWSNMTVVGTLTHLQVLKLRWHSFVGKEWESNEGEFSKLKFLEMSDLSVKNWVTERTHFPCLEHLVIKSCDYLEGIPSEIGEFPYLKLIELRSCNSRVKESAREIQEEQLEYGNETLQVHVYD